MVWNEYYHTIVWLVYWKFSMLWDLENFTLGTEMVCNDYYQSYIGTLIVFWDLECLCLSYGAQMFWNWYNYFFLWLKLCKFEVLWDLGNPALGTQRVCKYYYHNISWSNYWNFKMLWELETSHKVHKWFVKKTIKI